MPLHDYIGVEAHHNTTTMCGECVWEVVSQETEKSGKPASGEKRKWLERAVKVRALGDAAFPWTVELYISSRDHSRLCACVHNNVSVIVYVLVCLRFS